MTKEFKIYDKFERGDERGKSNIYQTSEGEMDTTALAKRLSLSVSGLGARVRAYGPTDPRVIYGPKYYADRVPDWQGLSDKSRSSNLNKLEGKTMSYFLK